MSQASSALVAVITLVLGGFGALIAIFLKEAVTTAMQQRVIVWQLQGYLMSWRSQILQHAGAIAIYDAVKERDEALGAALRKGTEEFNRVHAKQFDERAELRKKIKETAINDLKAADDVKAKISAMLPESMMESLAEHRKQLTDSKSFISDRDAALLGRGVALHAVQFRTSLMNCTLSMEACIKVLAHGGENAPAGMAHCMDHIVVYGESFLVAMVRLEREVAVLSRLSLFQWCKRAVFH